MGKTVVDENDSEDEPFLLDKSKRHKKIINPREKPILTRGALALKRFKTARPTISQEQRDLQIEVYRTMPKDTDFETLQALGRPCDMELHTSTVIPDLHKQAAFVRKRMQQGEGKASQVIFKYDQIRKKHAVFALVQESFKYYKLITQILEDTEFFKTYPHVERHVDLVHVLVYEMLFGKGLDFAWPHKAVQAIQRHRNHLLRALYQWASSDPSYLLPFKALPRYARVNTIKENMEHVVSSFSKRGYRLVNDVKPKHYAKLESQQFCIDPDVPNLLVFAPGTNLAGPEYEQYNIILQDKASCFSALALLDPDQRTKPKGVLDACAAPGNKTIHLAALLNQTMSEYTASSSFSSKQQQQQQRYVPLTAVEQDHTRFGSLKNHVYQAYAKVRCINADFLSLDPSAASFKDVTHILVDPSCSGSGMVSPFAFTLEEQKLKAASTDSTTTSATRTTRRRGGGNGHDDLVCLPDDYEDKEYFDVDVDVDEDKDKDKEHLDVDESTTEDESKDGQDEGESEDHNSDSDSEDSDQEGGREDSSSSNEEEGGDWVPHSEDSGEEEEEPAEEEQEEEEKEEEGEEDTEESSTTLQKDNKKRRKRPHSDINGSNVKSDHQLDPTSTGAPPSTSPESVAWAYSVRRLGEASVTERVERLRNFQISAIKHALKFPAVQRIVYSTCSIYVEENEEVVEEILQQYPDFQLVAALPKWNHRGLDIFEGGSLCARASPQHDAATGFFVACFERRHPNNLSTERNDHATDGNSSTSTPSPPKLNKKKPTNPANHTKLSQGFKSYTTKPNIPKSTTLKPTTTTKTKSTSKTSTSTTSKTSTTSTITKQAPQQDGPKKKRKPNNPVPIVFMKT